VDGCRFFFSGGDIALSDRNPSAGDSVTVTASIRNAGSVDAVSAEAQLLLDGVVVATAPIVPSTFPGGDLGTATFTLIAPPEAGYHRLEVVADPSNAIAESNELNNRAGTTLLVGAAPDLTVTSLVTSAASVTEGETVLLEATVENIGSQDAFSVTVSFFDGSELIGSVSGLDFVASVSESHTVALPFRTNGLAGLRTITATVDPADLVPETDETNNSLSTTVDVLPSNTAPTVTLTGPVSAGEGSTAGYTFTTSDPDIGDTFTLVSADGGANGTLSNLVFNAATGSGSFEVTFGDGASNTIVSVQVRDSAGADSNVDSLSVTILNVAPTANLSNDGPVDEGSSASVSFSNQSDASTADTNAGFRYAYDLDNDGTFDIGDGTYAGGSTATSTTVPASDRLVANGGDDILIGARTIYDSGPVAGLANSRALLTILDAWNSNDDAATRKANIEADVDNYFLRLGESVLDDGAADKLTGSAGDDWFLLFTGDVATDLKTKKGDLVSW
jgi:hypothetical protein